MRKEIYLQLIRLLNSKDEIKHISLWNENIENLETEPTFQMPAVFIEFGEMEWKQGGNRAKNATTEITLHIITETLADISADAEYREEALSRFDIIDKAVASVECKGGKGFNKLQHKRSMTDHNHGRVCHDMEVFVCEVTDKRQVPEAMTMQDLKPEITA